MSTSTAPSDSSEGAVHLTPEQDRAVQAVRAWRHRSGEPLFWLTGYAGTGKSTVARYAAEGGRVAFLAPTGKAASVLRRKGCAGASTIHKVLYTPRMRSSEALEELVDMLSRATDRASRDLLQQQIAEETARLQQPAWEYNEDTWLTEADLVVVDEASMVGEKVLEDLLRTVPKVLCLGDPGQLPPVRARSPLLDRRPDAHLEQIHRHAQDSDILRLATYVRTHGHLPAWPSTDELSVRPLADAGWPVFQAADVVLVYANATRQQLNLRFRDRLGYPATEALVPGERIVCLRNNYFFNVYNGTTATVTAAASDEMERKGWLADLATDDGPRPMVPVILSEKPEDLNNGTRRVAATYGYALTVHKSQGSEWDHVLVWVPPGASPAWLYTAVTRAARRLTLVV